MPLKDKIASVVTGDAYDKPAKYVLEPPSAQAFFFSLSVPFSVVVLNLTISRTEVGAVTTTDSSDAHTTEGTSSDPKVKQKIEDAAKNAEEAENEQGEGGASATVGKFSDAATRTD
jgi:hypothetical protein